MSRTAAPAATFARDFMNTRSSGNINVGLLFGLLQFVSTFLIALVTRATPNSKFDPLADRLRGEIEGSRVMTRATADRRPMSRPPPRRVPGTRP